MGRICLSSFQGISHHEKRPETCLKKTKMFQAFSRAWQKIDQQSDKDRQKIILNIESSEKQQTANNEKQRTERSEKNKGKETTEI